MNSDDKNMFKHFEALKEKMAEIFDANVIFDAGDIDDDESPVYFTWRGKHKFEDGHLIELEFLNEETKKECLGLKGFEEALKDVKCICFMKFCYDADFDAQEYIKLKAACQDLFSGHKIAFRKQHAQLV